MPILMIPGGRQPFSNALASLLTPCTLLTSGEVICPRIWTNTLGFTGSAPPLSLPGLCWQRGHFPLSLQSPMVSLGMGGLAPWAFNVIVTPKGINIVP